MNEEQSDKLINILDDIKNYMKEKQIIKEVIKEVKPLTLIKLQRFKNLIISNDFWNTLSKEQKEKIIQQEQEAIHDSDLFKTPDINDICERCFRKHYSLLSKIDNK